MRDFKLLMFILLFPITVYSQKLNPEGLKMVKELDIFNVYSDIPTDTCIIKHCYTYDDNGRMVGMEVFFYDGKKVSYKMKNGKLERYHPDYPWQKCEFFFDDNGNLVRWLLYSDKEPKTDCTLYDTRYIYTYNQRRGEYELKQCIRMEAWRDKGTDEFVYGDPKFFQIGNYDTFGDILQHYIYYKQTLEKPPYFSTGIKNDLNIALDLENFQGGGIDWTLIERTEWIKHREEYIPQRELWPLQYEFDEKGNLIKICTQSGRQGYLIKYVD